MKCEVWLKVCEVCGWAASQAGQYRANKTQIKQNHVLLLQINTGINSNISRRTKSSFAYRKDCEGGGDCRYCRDCRSKKVSVTHLLCDNLKARDASASKKVKVL